MSVLNIYVRQDLKMRKGKMAAQSAHAAMKLLFEVMKKALDKMFLGSAQNREFQAFLNNPVIKIHMVKDEAAMNNSLDMSLPYAKIIDSGRTEFHGVPTLTCAAQGIFSVCKIEELQVPYAYGKDIKAKQIFVFNKDFQLSKESACELSVLSCLKLLNAKMKVEGEEQYFDLKEDGPFVDWILNAFAKIGLSTKTLDDLIEVESVLSKNYIQSIHIVSGENHCLCIEPCYPNDIDPITGSLSLI